MDIRTPNPQSAIRPTKEKFAPSASALKTSVPRRMPPSKWTGTRPATGLDDAWECFERGGDAVELPAAVVGDDDAVGAGLDGHGGVFGAHY
jgi:hypothetical protein